MNFAFSEEQEELRRYAAQWLADKSDSAAVRAAMDTADGYSREMWAETAELGWPSMAIPEEYGGAGFGFLELAVLLEEQGKSLFTGPFLSTVVMGTTALLEAGSEAQKKDMLPAVAAGELTLALATDDGERPMRATRDGDGWRLDGQKTFVVDGHTADLILILADTDSGPTLFLIDGDAAGVSRTALETMDATRKLATIDIDGLDVDGDRVVGSVGSASDVVARVGDVAMVALALEQVGGAQRCLDMAVAYAKDRVQFGRPIGSFQSIKHKCADMLVAVESARATAYYAAWAVSENSDEMETVVPLAKAFCSDAYLHCAGENIQIHGGIGFTWEHDAHLYFKRAKSSQLMFGDPAHHRRILAERVGI